MKLNKELMTRWIEALESGDYLQGHNQLMDRDAEGQYVYCCLGVLQQIEPKIKGAVADDEIVTFLDQDSVLEVMGCDIEQTTLAELNDGLPTAGVPGQSFKQIAQHLREKYKIAA